MDVPQNIGSHVGILYWFSGTLSFDVLELASR
jgi:hypothetical protein